MRCGKCGTSLSEGEVFCPECGIRVDGVGKIPLGKTAGSNAPGELSVDSSDSGAGMASPPGPPVPQQAPSIRAKTSGFATASLVLGIAGIVLCPIIAALLALIFGILARGEIKRGKESVTGSGMAIAGITLGIIGMVIPLVIASVAIPLVLVFVRPEIRAAGKLLDGASAARIYYFEHDDSYKGMRDTDLENINDSVEFRMAPGRGEDIVYVNVVTDQVVRLYCLSVRGNRYTATARGDQWRYSSRFWRGASGWFDHRDQNHPFE